MFEAAIAAAQPALCVPPHLPQPPEGRLIVIGAGKASAAMAKAAEDNWKGELSGLVVTRHGYNIPCKRIEIVEAAHPVPDGNGFKAAQRMMSLVRNLTEKDMVLCLFSGGGSALLPLPIEGLTLEDKQRVNESLLKSGAAISEINCVRRHLSAIKGGRLAAACWPAKVVNLLISDVPGDNAMDIASGPTVADTTTCADTLTLLDAYKIPLPAAVIKKLKDGTAESIKPGDPRISNVTTKIIATPQMALEKAAAVAEKNGITAYILSDHLEGEARSLGKRQAFLTRQTVRRMLPMMKPRVLLSGGETTVTVQGTGHGGRNVEFLLSLGVTLDEKTGVYALAGDTDGVDGTEEIAGGFLAPDSLTRARALGIDPVACLNNNDAHSFFKRLGDSIITGPTFTNVNDFRAILVLGRP